MSSVVDGQRYKSLSGWRRSRVRGTSIEAEGQEGWAFFELDTVDRSKGGAPREQLDALRLIAVFLAHWDNKAENQRLVCLSETGGRDTVPEPFLLLQDVGATFGPRKVDLAGWEKAAIWEDRATCTISMRDMPYEGGTFRADPDLGRRASVLAGLLGELTDEQLTELFAGARFDKRRSPLEHGAGL